MVEEITGKINNLIFKSFMSNSGYCDFVSLMTNPIPARINIAANKRDKIEAKPHLDNWVRKIIRLDMIIIKIRLPVLSMGSLLPFAAYCLLK